MMDFYGVLDQILDLLQRRGRVSYRALKRQFHLEDDYLEDLKEALLYAHAQVISDDGRGLVWTGAVPPPPADERRGPEAERHLHALLPGVMALLRHEGRVTYRTLTDIFGLDETSLEDIRKELGFKRLALDEDGEGLVWTGEGPLAVPSAAALTRPPAPLEAVAVPSPASPDRSAHVEAISHITAGIELLKTLPETPARIQQALTLYIALGAALQVTKGYGAPEVEHAYAQTRAWCQQVGETPELVPVLFGL
jgi:hypothetical protein